MGKLGGIALIATGVIIIFNIVIMAVGGLKVMIGLFMPINKISVLPVLIDVSQMYGLKTFKFLPLNEMLKAWVDVPLSMGLTAYLTGIEPLDEDGMIGGGILDFKVTLNSGGPEDEDIPAVAVIFIQEDAEIDEIQRYVLRAGPLNYPSIFFWLVSLGSLGGMLLSIIVRIKVRGKGKGKAPPKETAAVAPEPPPQAVVSVIPLEDNEDPEKD